MPAKKVKRFRGSSLALCKAGKKRGQVRKRALVTARSGVQRVYANPGTAPLMRYCVLEPLKFGMTDKYGSCVQSRPARTPNFVRITL